MNETELKQVGGIWKTTSKAGNKYLSMKFEQDVNAGEYLKAFPNKYKEEGDKKPDLIIYKSQPKEQEKTENNQSGKIHSDGWD